MAEVNVPWVSFNGGEIGAEAQARIDLEVYPTCCATMENILPSLQGSMSKAPGTEYIGSTPDDEAAVLRPYVYNIDQALMLEFSEQKLRFIAGGGFLTITGASASVGNPVDNGSGGASSVTPSSVNATLSAAYGETAKARWPVTTAQTTSQVTIQFTILRRPLKFRVGTTTTGAELISEVTLYPGFHSVAFTPNAATYYVQVDTTETGGAQVTGMTAAAAGELELTTPYAESDLPSLRYEQSNDVFWIYCQGYRTRVLERRANTFWSLRTLRPLDGPFEAVNTSAITLTPSAVRGTATLTASASLFRSADVGQLYELTHQGQQRTLVATAGAQESTSIRVFGVDDTRKFTLVITGTWVGTVKLQRSLGNEVDWQDYLTYTGNTSVTIDDGLDNQIVYYRLLSASWSSGTATGVLNYSGGYTIGRCEVVAYTSATEVTVEVLSELGGTTAVTDWSAGSWSDYLGWPAAGTLYDGRHCLVRDDRFWASQSDDYEAFALGDTDSDALSRRLGTGSPNAARWVRGANRLLIGTGGAEVEVRSSNFDEPITPSNNALREIDTRGSADAQAMKSGKRVLFISRSRMRLYQLLFDLDTNSHRTDDLTRLHKAIAGEGDNVGFVEIAVQREPEPWVWAVREDGELAVMLFGPDESVYAWARVTAANDCAFESVGVLPGTPEDRVYAVVRRVIDGQTKRYIERFALHRWTEIADANRLQCSASYEGAEADTLSGLDHLEGEDVYVWHGATQGPFTVTGGAITGLSPGVTSAIVGLNYEGRWKSGKLAYGARMGTALGANKHVNKLGLVVYRTPGGAFGWGRDFDHCTDRLPETDDNTDLDASMVEVTDEYAGRSFEGGNEVDSRVCVLMDTPAPVTLLAMVPHLELAEDV